MTETYQTIDPNGNLEFEDIFSKRGYTFSGSEEQEFYFSKILAINEVLKHDFPIIVDSFRDGEISTIKEERMLQLYSNLNKQVLLTSTLKNEEYESQKYEKENNINSIDYSSNQDCKILSTKFKDSFVAILNSFEGLKP